MSMGKHIFTFCLCLIAIHFTVGQINCRQNFEGANWETDCGYDFYIDSTNADNFLWQVGQPNKNTFDTALSGTNALVTDLDSFYPTNTESSLIIYHYAELGSVVSYGIVSLSGFYRVETDSLNDYGTILISYDNGKNWIDLINDTVYSSYIYWWHKPSFTGNSNGWEFFNVDIIGLGHHFNVNGGDSVLYKFSFHSDSIPDTLAGLMFDSLKFFDIAESIEEKDFTAFTSYIYPNPASDNSNVYFENADNDFFEFKLYNLNGKQLGDTQYFKNEKIPVNIDRLSNGIYIYSLVSERHRKKSVGKFIVGQ